MSKKRTKRSSRRSERPLVVRVVWNPPTPHQARELVAAMDRFIEAERRSRGS